MAMGEMMGATPVYEVGGNDGFGGSWIWLILFILLLGGGNGFGFGRDTAGAVDTFALNNVERQLQGIQNGICSSSYETLSNFKDLSAQMASCCCETNRNIDAVRYENAKNTCDIIQAANANTQAIIDKMTASEIQALRDNLLTANMQLSQQAQTSNLIATLRPAPIPAFITNSPYESINTCGLC